MFFPSSLSRSDQISSYQKVNPSRYLSKTERFNSSDLTFCIKIFRTVSPAILPPCCLIISILGSGELTLEACSLNLGISLFDLILPPCCLIISIVGSGELTLEACSLNLGISLFDFRSVEKSTIPGISLKQKDSIQVISLLHQNLQNSVS